MIYFITGESEGYPVKIGYTAKNVHKRLENLQVGNPEKLFVIGTTEGNCVYEGVWHREFSQDWVFGEWFRRTDRLMNAIEESKTRLLFGYTPIPDPRPAERAYVEDMARERRITQMMRLEKNKLRAA